MMHRRLFIAAIVMMALVFAAPAQATSILVLTSGSATSGPIVAVGSGPEIATFTGDVGDWSINITSGIAGTGLPIPIGHLDLLSYNYGVAGAAPLTITFTSDVNMNFLDVFLAIGGTLAPGFTLTYEAFADGNLAAGLSFPSSPAFSGTISGGVDAWVYKLTQQVVITAPQVGGAAGGTSFDAVLQPVPDAGGTLTLLGVAMLGLGVWRRRQK